MPTNVFWPMNSDVDDRKYCVCVCVWQKWWNWCEWLGWIWMALPLTYCVYHAPRWCRLRCKTANSRTRHLSCQSSTAQSPPTILRSGCSGIWVHWCHSATTPVCSALNGWYNCISSLAYPCDTAPNTHCSCNNGGHPARFRRCIDISVAPHSLHVSADRFRCF